MSEFPQITFDEYETLVFAPHCDGEYAMELLKRVCPDLHQEVTLSRPEFDMTQDGYASDRTMAYLKVHWPNDLQRWLMQHNDE